MDPAKESTECPAREKCPVFLAMRSGTVRYAPSGLGLALKGNLGEQPWDTDSQPHPDEGHPPPLEAVPVPWKSVGPCKSHRESLGSLVETPAGKEAQGEEDPAASRLDVLRLRSSSMEIREKGSEFLKEELHKAQKELRLKDAECERLSRVRTQLEQELEELTASLFEEAHKMVREANMKQAASEKQLKETRGKIDMLQAEVTALKTLVITSTPASPNRELHPQLLSPTKAGPRKGHLRHKSTSSALCPAVCPVVGHALTPDKEGKEVDTTLFAEFQAWRESPTLDKTSPFLERVYREDVGPCLDFTMQELSALVRAAVEDNTLTIEPAASQTLPAVKVAAVECGRTNTCALSGLACACRHRIRLGDSESHYYISPSSRARVSHPRGVLPGSLEAPWAGTLSPRLHNLQSTEQGTGSERSRPCATSSPTSATSSKAWCGRTRSPCSGRSQG
ncbi:guanine nucleotide exchange factor for Rab-3A isoform X2 [Balaenoptera ricei]|uniref:guanine nucleotide exchange factor for Rab-3A isoform X2 n=1 Tax=Balaenoptera ricei TaxID=2746895 RepID=UPI0028BE44C5|nr:guanine nucleotide exchange factor for Rab-3A isoform X2 [Balaenoptera ricei]